MFELGYQDTHGEWHLFAMFEDFAAALNEARKTIGLDIWMIYRCHASATVMLACSKGK